MKLIRAKILSRFQDEESTVVDFKIYQNEKDNLSGLLGDGDYKAVSSVVVKVEVTDEQFNQMEPGLRLFLTDFKNFKLKNFLYSENSLVEREILTPKKVTMSDVELSLANGMKIAHIGFDNGIDHQAIKEVNEKIKLSSSKPEVFFKKNNELYTLEEYKELRKSLGKLTFEEELSEAIALLREELEKNPELKKEIEKE